MGTAPIKDVMSYFPSNTGVDAPGKAPQAGEVFAKAMSDAAVKTGAANNPNNAVDAVKQADDAGKRIRKPDNAEIAKLDRRNTSTEADSGNDKTVSAENKANAGKAIEEKAVKIGDAIKDELGITDEELEEAMAALGLVMTDLLNPDNIKELMLNISGETDPMALITNEELLTGINNIIGLVQETVDEISEEFGISQEEISSIIEEMHTADVKPEETEVKPVSEENEDDEPISDTVRVEINRTDDTDTGVRSSEVSAERASMERKVTQMMTDRKQDDGTQNAMSGQGFTQEAAPVDAVPETSAQMPVSYTDTENILRQVTDHIRVNIGTDSTSMELQLHPASLGTVNLQIASTNGVITANLLVQNEAVKAALESQMVKLLETFEEQGQKVEAIEVSVAGYDLDRSLSGEGGNEGNDRKDNGTQGIGRTTRRRLNLNELNEEDIEDLTEEEQLAAEMMNANGTSVDYLA